jgi:hypothetical protein
MQPDNLPQLIAVVITIALLVIAGRRYGSDWLNLMKQLSDELVQRMPVYSAESTQRKEAEFIRDRAPKKHSARMFLLLIVVLGAAAWWLTS